MERTTINRKFYLGSFETISFEAEGEAETLEEARIIATNKILLQAKQEMIRIFGIRGQNTYSNPYDQVEMELQGIEQELSHLK